VSAKGPVDLSDMRILITGGAGFIASQIADAYVQDGHDVAILDNLSSGTRENIPSTATYYECDVRDTAEVGRIFDEYRPEVVSHHAAQLDVRKAIEDPVYDATVNILGGLNILTNAVRVGTKRLIFASTGGAIYGEPEIMPVSESAPKAPESPYGLTKASFESYLQIWQKLHGITPVVLRYSNVYGPRQGALGEAGVVAVFSKLLLKGKDCTIYGDGTSARDYVYVGDVVEANRLALSKGDGQAINIGTGELTTIGEVFEAIRESAGAEQAQANYVPARPGEVYRICLENKFAQSVLGWTPQTSFAQGVQNTVDWLRTSTLV
jgi:UDP-glucose 4-epimerase